MPLSGSLRRFLSNASFWQWLGLFLVVTGARFALIERYSTPVPFWDQWDAEAAGLIKPWLEGTWGWHALFAPHNEHRIVLTRVTALALLVLNGQWDPALEMAVNAVFWAGSAVLVGVGLTHAFAGQFRRTILGAVTLCFALPFGWENTLSGFQSQSYYLILFSLAALWGLGTARRGSPAWWTGLAGAGLACLSMGSGFLAAAAVLALLGWRCGCERRAPVPGEMLTALVCVGLIAVGWLTRVELSVHTGLRAESTGAFAASLGRFLAWPLGVEPWLGLIAVTPLGWLAVAGWRGPARNRADKEDERRRDELLLGVGGWVVLQAAALAFGRGGHGALPAPRYQDLLAVGTLANFLAWLALLRRARRERGLWRWVALGAAAWTLLVVAGGWEIIRDDFQSGLPFRAEQMRQGEANVHGYVATRDFARFLHKEPLEEVPYPDPVRLAAILDDPTLRPVLPAAIRVALPLCIIGPDDNGGNAFVPDGFPPACPALPATRVWGSYSPEGREAARGESHAFTAGPARLPYVQMLFAGDAVGPGMKFSLWVEGDRAPARWHPGGTTRNHWRAEHLHVSRSGFLNVSATDGSATRWFAFTEPVEMGGWSYWAGYARRQGKKIFVAGLVLALAAEGRWQMASRRRKDGYSGINSTKHPF